MKKIGALFMALVLVIAMVGCGKADKAPEEKKTAEVSNTEATEEKDTKKDGGKVKIEYWNINSERLGADTVEELVQAFNASQDKYEVVNRFIPGEYEGLIAKLQAEVVAGNAPGVIQLGWQNLNYFANNFPYASPKDIIEKYFPEDKTFLEDNFLPNILDLATNSEGKLVGMPYSLSTPLIYYNADIFEQAGLPKDQGPKSWEDVIAFSKIIKEKTGKYGLYTREGGDNWTQQAIMESNGAKMMETVDGKTKAVFASPEGIAAFQKYADMVLVDKTCFHASWDEGVQGFLNGEVAMLHGTSGYVNTIQNSAKFDVRSVRTPYWEGHKASAPAGGNMLAIPTEDPEEQKAAWEFIKFLVSVDSMAKWTKGTGYIPTRNGVLEAENGLKSFVEENKLFRPAVEQLENVSPWASFPGDSGVEAEKILVDTREEILQGTVDAATGLKKAQDSINALLDAQ